MLTRSSLITLSSDQLYMWSDGYSERTRSHTTKTPQRSCAPAAATEIDPAGLPHRAIQALWQAGMQVRRRTWTWSQVLSVGKLSWPAAANGLRAAGCLRTDCRVSCQLSPQPRDSGNDLRDQPRTSAPSRSALERHSERVSRRRPRPDRCGVRRRVSRQHAHMLARWRPGEFILFGGSR
jgi:hypothetical protein